MPPAPRHKLERFTHSVRIEDTEIAPLLADRFGHEVSPTRSALRTLKFSKSRLAGEGFAGFTHSVRIEDTEIIRHQWRRYRANGFTHSVRIEDTEIMTASLSITAATSFTHSVRIEDTEIMLILLMLSMTNVSPTRSALRTLKS